MLPIPLLPIPLLPIPLLHWVLVTGGETWGTPLAPDGADWQPQAGKGLQSLTHLLQSTACHLLQARPFQRLLLTRQWGPTHQWLFHPH
jgi:hypothetical protein